METLQFSNWVPISNIIWLCKIFGSSLSLYFPLKLDGFMRRELLPAMLHLTKHLLFAPNGLNWRCFKHFG
ncbi:MAG: hypothetical protein ACOYYU_11640, partial [Chloroflexota bacterium]